MEFLLAEVIGLRPAGEIGQLQLKIAHAVTQVVENKAAVGGLLLSHDLEPQGLVIKFQRTLQVEDVKIEMVKRE